MNGETATTETGTEIVARVGETVSSAIDDLRRAVVDAPVFEVHQIEGRTVVTAATVSFGGGFGFGGGGPDASVRTVGLPAVAAGDSEAGPAAGGGGGGGAGGEGRPVAVIEVVGGEVRIRPVVDWTKVGAAIVAALVTMWVASRRAR